MCKIDDILSDIKSLQNILQDVLVETNYNLSDPEVLFIKRIIDSYTVDYINLSKNYPDQRNNQIHKPIADV
ncbi:hypothetical protein HNQ80_002682 [Anaerosolibacter carboniphilus]|uniref:Spo0E like sporulation regulatory protein n=1 Tax=Anaerosolibacter carboniphilus TaxID=1417629 RepID=A0A841KWF4_9FIRM|nr:hypothetical protein [Anaerosolibacter carboniphilus]MBB6216578.1 hypothetical protein [Anaerosolibacter carboniphilus]